MQWNPLERSTREQKENNLVLSLSQQNPFRYTNLCQHLRSTNTEVSYSLTYACCMLTIASAKPQVPSMERGREGKGLLACSPLEGGRQVMVHWNL